MKKVKKIDFVVLAVVTGILLLVPNLFMGQERMVVEPVDNGQALINPGMGWTMHFYSNSPAIYGSRLAPNDSLDWFEGCSTVYLRIPWAYLEPEEGEYNWALFDTPAQRWINAGKKVALRMTTSESWLDYATPRWVEEAGAKMVRYEFKNGPKPDGPLHDPVFDDPIFLEKLENFLAAAAKRYDGNPNIAFIDIGSFGLWGEGHTCFTQKLSGEDNARIAQLHAELYLKYFSQTQLCILDDTIGPESAGVDFPLMDWCVEKGITLRDDSILVQRAPQSWFHAELASKFWPRLPVILEHEHYGGSVGSGAWDDELLLKAVEDYHASYLSIHGFPDDMFKERADIIHRINLRLGYRIVPKKVEYPREVRIGDRFDVDWEWSNAGVAPCYCGGFPALTVEDDAGGLVAVLSDEKFNVRELETGSPDSLPTKSVKSTFRLGYVAPVTKPGTYQLYLSVGQRDGTPVLALPMDRDDGHRRYCLGPITLVE